MEWVLSSGFIEKIATYIYTKIGIKLTAPQIIAFVFIFLIVPLILILITFPFLRRGSLITKNNPIATGRFAFDKEIDEHFVIPTEGRILKLSIPLGSSVVFFAVTLLFSHIHGGFYFSPVLAGVSVVVATVGSLIFLEVSNPVGAALVENNFFRVGFYKKGIFSKPIGLSAKRRMEGVFIPGPPGAGKTSNFLIGNVIYDAFSTCSVFYCDVKPDEDVGDIVGHAWNIMGKKVVVFDPYREGHDFHINPLLMIDNDFSKQETFDAIRAIIDSIFGSYFANIGDVRPDTDHFIGREFRLLRAIIMACLKLPYEYRNLPTMLDIIKQTPAELTRFIAMTRDKEVIDEFRFFADADDTEKANAMQGLYRKMQFLDSPLIRASLIRNDFDLNDFFKEPCLLILKAPLHREDMKVIASMIGRLLMLKTYERAEKAYAKKTKPFPVWFYFDEFARLNLPKVDVFAATVRSSYGGVHICVQDKDDIVGLLKKFNTGSAKSTQASLRTFIILPGCSYDMCKEFSDSLGETTYIDYQRQRGAFQLFNFEFRQQVLKTKLMTPDAIRHMSDDECIIQSGNIRAFKLKMRGYFKDPYIRRLVPKRFLDRDKRSLKLLLQDILYGLIYPSSKNRQAVFYKPKVKQDIKLGDLQKLLKQRPSDIEEIIDGLEGNKKNTGINLVSDDNPSQKPERSKRVLDMKDDLESENVPVVL